MAEPAYLSFYLGSDTIYVFYGVLQRLGRPTYVRLLINPGTMQLAMLPYHRKEFTSFRVPKALYGDPPGRRAGFRIRSRAFCQLLAAKMEWDADKSYRVPGEVYPKCFIARFDLERGREINAGR